MLQRVFLLLLVTALAGLPTQAQSIQDGRQRDWSEAEVQRWLDAQSRQRLSGGVLDDECPDFTNRRDAILNGNRITTQIFNFGSVSAPGNTITNVVWNGLGYGYEFGPFVAAEVVDTYREEGRLRDPQSVPRVDENGNVVLNAQGDTTWVMRIVSDGLVSNGGEVSPDGSTFWGWQPIPCTLPVGGLFDGLQVVEPTSSRIPTSDAPDANLDGKPDSWPESWYNDNLERFVWPGALQQGASNADKEALYFMNDYANQEFGYFPFWPDTTRKGLGLEIETRLYQWANPLAEDAIFLIYKITNKSDRDLENVIFGMWGDPHVGGPRNWFDDLAFFDRDLNMVFAFDSDGISDIAGREPGYFGYIFLESPGIGNEVINGQAFPGDGIDNDGDGLVDESWTDGIDNDGDWNPERDDVGIDGIPGTGDEGEDDGLPTAGDPFDITKPGEPNFEFTDIDESDQIGLTSFASPPFAGNRVSNDERVWDFVQPGRFDDIPSEPGDYVFLYGSGPISLRAGETKRFSIALILGENFEDLVLNAETVQQIYDVGYRFAKPPEKPIVRAVPGDGQVTLYWDDRAEASVDPLSNERDFEGYVIYRSTDPLFSDQQTITDINGSSFLFAPHTNSVGVEAKFDLKNGITGPSSVPFPRRGVAYDLGDDTGLFHSYVDSNNVVNGQTYFYTVVAYDRGFTEASELGAGGIPPSETSKTITYDPTTDSYIFDVNTVRVIPGPRTAGYVPPSVEAAGGVQRVSGNGTGPIDIRIVDELAVPDEGQFVIDFREEDGQLVYDVINDVPQEVIVAASLGKSAQLGFRNILPGSFELRTSNGTTLAEGTNYTLNPELGTVIVTTGANEDDPLTAVFKYRPVASSPRLAGEEGNLVFDGLDLFVTDEPLEVDQGQTGWTTGGRSTLFEVLPATAGPGRLPQPSDYEIRFGEPSTSVSTNLELPFTIYNLTQANQPIQAFVPDVNRNGSWDVNEQIIFIEDLPTRSQTATWEVRFSEATPQDGDIFYVATRKPFGESDQLLFRTQGARSDPEQVAENLDEIYVVPNPYVATNEIEPRNPFSNTERGDRRLYFANLPPQCTIRIYSLAGELVDTIEHNEGIENGRAFWDLRTKDNMNIAYGLYIYHVDSPEGTHIGKFAVIK
ncbi:MAG: hypothetical protein AAGI71_02825 [Bacteroidota bacterium]